MSTKTTLKRIALVAVSALGFGVMTAIAPANAAPLVVSSVTAGTSSPARVGAVSSTTITVAHTAAVASADTTAVAAKVTNAPATSTLLTDTHTATKGITLFSATTISSSNAYVPGGANATLTSSNTASPGTSSTAFTLRFVADVAGTYTILVSAGNSSFTAGDKATTITITTVGAPTALTVTSLGGVASDRGTFGQLFALTMKDANGNATVLGPNESLDFSETDATVTLKNNANDTTISSFAPYTNSSANATGVQSSSGTYRVRAVGTNTGTASTTTADGTALLTFTGGGLLPATLTVNTNITTAAANGALTSGDLTYACSVATSCDGTFTKGQANSVNVSGARTLEIGGLASLTTADIVYAVDIETGTTSAPTNYSTTVTLAKTATAGATTKVSIAVPAPATSAPVKITLRGATAGSQQTFNIATPAANAIVFQGASGGQNILSATGAANKFTVRVNDQFGAAMSFVGVFVGVTGRNTVAATNIGVTDANGLISYTLTDKGTTGTKDTITFARDAALSTNAVVATVTYGTVTVGSVAVTGGSTVADAGVEGANLTQISAAGAGPHGNAKDITATVKDANGNLLAGVAVTFAVSKGLIQKTASIDYTTVYTGSDGKAVTKVIDWTPGKQTITATAGGVSKSDYLTWAATDATSARVVSATVTGNVVSVKVVDRYGNPVTGVSVDLSREGTGFFGNGTSAATVKTDKFGTADVQFNGNAKVTAALDTAVYAQSADLAGEVAATAVTAAVAGTTVGTGASLAPAGVNKVTVTVAEGTDPSTVAANAAADAAAEAIDAANAATDAANLAAEAADAATVAAEEARDAADAATAAVEELATQVATLMAALKAQITTLANTVAKIARKVRA